MSFVRTLAPVVLVLSLAACATPPSESSPLASVAVAFSQAIDTGDFAAACSLLTPAVRSDVEEEQGVACPEAVAALGLTSGGTVQDTKVYGRAALVTMVQDTTFLARSGTTWAIRAAGCAPKEEGPFDCALGGN